MSLNIKEIFPNESYTSDEIYEIADENDLQIDDTDLGTFTILEIVECFHERDDPSGRTPYRLPECDLTDDNHETLAEFRNDTFDNRFRLEE
jgi:hypothetical protein